MNHSMLNDSGTIPPQGPEAAPTGEATPEDAAPVAKGPMTLPTDPVGWEALLWVLGWLVA